jgi:hypothetical protein
MINSLKRKVFRWLKNGLNSIERKTDQILPVDNGLDETYLFDFKNYSSGYRGHSNNIFVGVADITVGQDSSSDNKTPIKVKIKPIDALEDLERVPTPFSLSNLDDKIAMLNLKEKHIVQHYAKREVSAIMSRLQNRKKYNEFKSFFEQFQYTNEEKVDALLAKYDLVLKTSDVFVPEFPDVAIKTMEEYAKNVEKLCNKKPVFYVIATEENFRKTYQKRDPILLAQCPFSFNWQILGAWDKEMMLLYEL